MLGLEEELGDREVGARSLAARSRRSVGPVGRAGVDLGVGGDADREAACRDDVVEEVERVR